MTLWYFETVSLLGRWSPCTMPSRPDTVNHVGHLRQQTVTGIGPRIRRIVEVPAGLADLPLNDLRRHLWGEGDEAAVAAEPGSAAA